MENIKTTTIGTRAVGPQTEYDNPILKQMVCFRSDYMKQIDAKFDKIFDIIASMQLHLQTQVTTKGNGSRYDSCVEDTTPFFPTPTDDPKTLATTKAATGPNDLPPLVCFHEKNNIEECCFVETPLPTPFPSQPPKYSHPLPPLFSSEHKIEKISEYFGDVSATIEKIEVNIVEIGSGISPNRWSGIMKIHLLDDCKQVYRTVNGNYKFGYLEFFKQVAADHNVRKILVNASRSVEGKKNKWITWSFDPGGCHMFDESFNKRIYEFHYSDSHGRALIAKPLCEEQNMNSALVAHTCNCVIHSIHFVSLGPMEFHSSFWSQSKEAAFVFNQHQMTKFLYDKIIHHWILVEWEEEPPNRISFNIDLSVAEVLPSWRIKLSFQSYLSLLNMFLVVTTRSFGVEDSIQAAEPILVFKGLLGYSFTWSVRGALVELGTMFLEKGSYVVWKWIIWDQIWFCGISGICPESESFKDDGLTAIPSRWNGICREREEFNLSHCKRKLIGARWYIKDYKAEFGSLYTKGGAEFLSARDAEGHGTHTSSIVAGAVVENVSFSRLARGGAPATRLAIFKVFWAMGSCCSTDIFVAFDDAIWIVVNGVTIVVGISVIMNLGTLVLGHLQLSRGDTTHSRGEYCHVHNYD